MENNYKHFLSELRIKVFLPEDKTISQNQRNTAATVSATPAEREGGGERGERKRDRERERK